MQNNNPNQSKQRKPILFALIAAFTLILVVIVTYFVTLEKPVGENYKPIYEYGGEFTLQSSQGAVNLSDFEGKVVVIYFGFLNCTEACPLSMGTISKALKKLPAQYLDQVQVLFVSVDPERDDVDSLEKFSKYYDDDNIIGITGSKEQIDNLTDQYGVFFELVDLEQSELDYTVDHVSRFYMINQKGELITTLSHSTSPTELAAKIEEMVDEPVSIVPTSATSAAQ